MINLIKFEILKGIKSYNHLVFFVLYQCFSLLLLILLTDPAKISNFVRLFQLIIIILSVLTYTDKIFKDDYKSGYLELLLTINHASKIIASKFIAIYLITMLSVIISTIIVYIIFNITEYQLFTSLICNSLLSLIALKLSILLGAIDLFMKKNSNIINLILIQLLAPIIILIGLFIETNNYQYLLICLGITTIILTASFLLTKYLVENIYNK